MRRAATRDTERWSAYTLVRRLRAFFRIVAILRPTFRLQDLYPGWKRVSLRALGHSGGVPRRLSFLEITLPAGGSWKPLRVGGSSVLLHVMGGCQGLRVDFQQALGSLTNDLSQTRPLYPLDTKIVK